MKTLEEVIAGRIPVIYGIGRFQRDFEYVFQSLNTANIYLTDNSGLDDDIFVCGGGTAVDIDETNDDFFIGKYVIICRKEKETARKKLEEHGRIARQDFIEADELFPLLDEGWQTKRNGRILAFWGIGAECDYLERRSEVSCDVYIDIAKKGDKNGKPIISPHEIKDWRRYYIVVTSLKYYMEIKAKLQSYGLHEYEDFIIYRKLLSEDCSPDHRSIKPSEMLRKTIYTQPLQVPLCKRPFNYTELVRGNVFCCCPAWVEVAYGNMNVDSLEKIWNSAVARIFRLSIVNRTFVFCKKQECAHLKKYLNSSIEMNAIDDYRQVSEKPAHVLVSIDPRCNLKCPQCRSEFCTLTEAEENLLKLEVDRIHESRWLDKANLIVTGLGETFFSPIYRGLLYSGKKRKDTISILSNGLLCTEDEVQKLIAMYDNIFIRFSVDAATKKTYTKIRGGNFDLLIHNIKNLVRHRKNGEINEIGLSFVVQKDNYIEIPDFIVLSHELEVDWISFQKFHNPGYMTPEQAERYSIANEDDVPFKELIKVLGLVKDIKDPIIRWHQLSNYLPYVAESR